MSSLAREVLEAHNVYRSKHSAPPLQWSKDAAASADRWAKRLAGIGIYTVIVATKYTIINIRSTRA